MRILFAGGGTAGHLSPCIAVAQALQAQDPDAVVEFVISRRQNDAQMLATRSFIGHQISGSGMPYGCSPAAMKSLFQLAGGASQAFGIVRRFRPDLVFATGGFVSAAVVPAAHFLHVPVMLHASDVMPDRTNRLLARWARLVSTVAPAAGDQINAPTVVTGQPVRPEVLDADPAQARTALGIPDSAFVILITGGSQGAQTINDAVTGALPMLLSQPDTWLIHLAGRGKLPDSAVISALGDARQRYLVEETRSDMKSVLASADLVITRAGSNGLAEAGAWGRPMIIVPYPHAGGHQRFNADIYGQAGAAVVIDNADFTASVLADTIATLRGDEHRLSNMAQAAAAVGSRTAADAIVTNIVSIVAPQAESTA